MNEWWRGAVLYQIYPRSFQDGNGDGIGDLPGAIARLDHIAALGVDAVWIAPFFASPMADAGYDISDHCAIDPLFGTMADFDRFLERAHALGLKVLIDMVWGHTSDRHPWFTASRAREGDKSDWYVWADPRPDGSPPNNWLSVFGGGAWTWEPRRRQYYLHHFLAAQPTLNLRNPAVIDAMLAIGRFWLERGIDGFRLDAVDFYLHNPSLADNPPRPLEGQPPPAKPFAMQIHLNDGPQPDLLDLFGRIRGLLDAFPGRSSVAELSSMPEPLRRAALYTAARGGKLHMAYTLGLMRRDFSAASLRRSIAEAEEAFAEDGWLCWAFSNHDIERVASRWGDGSPAFAKLALALLLSVRGSVCLYQGEELGLTEADLAFEELRDPFGIAFWPDYKGRDGSRTPMPWLAEAQSGGFTTGRPWLPMPHPHLGQAADRQERQSDSVLRFARRMLAWRSSRPEMIRGTLRLIDLGTDLVAFERRSDTGRTLCVFNPSPRPVPVPALPGWRWIDPAGFARPAPDLPAWGAAFHDPDQEPARA